MLSRFRLLYIHFMNIINNDISPIAVLQFNPISFGIHYINDVRLLRKHYVTRHGFRGACYVLTPSNLFEKHPSLAVIVET